MQYLIKLICLSIVSLYAASALAQVATTDPWASQRLEFMKAEYALKKGEWYQFIILNKNLANYPLYPYLQYEELLSHLNTATTKQINQFLDKYPDTPLAIKIREQWLMILAKNKRWSEFLNYYKPSSNLSLQCFYLQALLTTEQQKSAYAQISTLWMTSRQLPENCASVTEEWISHGYLNSKLIWQRFQLAMSDKQLALAQQLIPQLPKSQQDLAIAWLEVYQHPEQILKPLPTSIPKDKINELVVYGLKQLAKNQPAQAVTAWPILEKNYAFSPELQQQVFYAIGLSLALNHQPDALSWLSKIDIAHTDQSIREWRVRAALLTHNWNTVNIWLNKLSPDEQQETAWQYWRARALEQLHQPALAKTIYHSLATQSDFYGFLANFHLHNKSIVPTNHFITLNAQELAQFNNVSGIERAHELLLLQRYADARTEWSMATEHMNSQQLTAASKLAHTWGWYDRCIMTAIRALQQNEWELYYPLGYKDQVLAAAKVEGLNAGWVFGIIRQESAFMSDIGSSAGALGLMQLLPITAQEMALNFNDQILNNYVILNPENNIRWGTHYLKKLLELNHHNLVLATASYNAGPHAVQRWLPIGNSETADIWIETIPWLETRHYVKNVMTFTLIYQTQLGEKLQISDWLKEIPS